MSVRLLTTRLVKHGRYFLQSFWKREIHTNILEHNQNKVKRRFNIAASSVSKAGTTNTSQPYVTKNVLSPLNGSVSSESVSRIGIFRFGQHARKLFIDNILNRVTTTYSEELRSQAKKKLFYGDSVPFFALVGVSLASGAGMLTKEDELEGVCWEIREAAARLQSSCSTEDVTENFNSDFNIDKLEIGPPIAKGCAAVVYAASLKSENMNSQKNIKDNYSSSDINSSNNVDNSSKASVEQQSLRPVVMSPIQNISRFVHNLGSSMDNLPVYNQSSAAAVFMEELANNDEHNEQNKDSYSNQAINAAYVINVAYEKEKKENFDIKSDVIDRYPLALKMMFNYDIQSNAISILRAMYKETVPARQRYIMDASNNWEQQIENQTVTVPPHPNIVCMYGFFCDQVGNFPGGHLLYPVAQPQRINPQGYGRNMSLYLLMKRYDCSLRTLLDINDYTARNKLLLFAQLLEAITHINRYGIAHRDIKSDNILIEKNDDGSTPILVLSDFGCCLADKINGLRVPYTSYDIDKGGNAALMAPEIINKQPGPFSVLNYEKSDLWACGAVAYEIFGLKNPFYSASGGLPALQGVQSYSLRNNDYKVEDLPLLNDDCPPLVQQLIHNILNPNPSKRISPDIAANIMQLFLWAPSKWLKNGGMPNSSEVLQWLLSLTTKVMCELRPQFIKNNLNFAPNGRRTYVEYMLICSFLARARLRRIRGAINWIQNAM